MMSNYRNSDFLNDFTTRTKENLKVIDNLFNAKKYSESIDVKDKLEKSVFQSNVYEITQRINSFFGFIILPFEKYNFKKDYKSALCKKCVKDVKIGEWVKKIKMIFNRCVNEERFYCSYNNIKKSVNDYDFEHVIKIIRHLRNSIAHGGNEGIMFFPLASNYENEYDVQIEEIIFYDINEHENEGYENEEFCIKLYVGNELDELWEAIVGLFIRIEELDIELKGREKEERSIDKKIKYLNNKMKKYIGYEREKFYK